LSFDAVRDVAIAGGKIAAVEVDIAREAADTIDARGKIAMAGLIDIHTHAGRSKDGPAMCFDWLLGVLLGIQLIAKASLLAIWLGRCVRVDHRGQKSAPFFARARTKGGKCE
jgi:imidazolonepropionase-like amidohydrolase